MSILEQFSEAFGPSEDSGSQSKAADLPEEIRNLIDGDEWQDLKDRKPGQWLYIEDGEIKVVES